jgi:hypothetical protein
MAKKAAKTRKAKRSTPASERKFVRTGEPRKVMQKLLDDLNEAKSGETGWSKLETAKVELATIQLKLAIAMLKCPPSPPGTVTQSYPGHGLHFARRRSK